MKVGTDAVLLAAWADPGDARHILDIGTGSGVIALIAAQRTAIFCQIDGVEIQEADCDQARANAAASPWRDRVRMIHVAVQDHDPPYRYDVILCNPPYFINSLRPPGDGRTRARHTVSLDHDMLISAVDRLLSPKGQANFIMPPVEGNKFRISMEASGMPATRICSFRTRAGKTVERVLMTFARSSPVTDSPLAGGNVHAVSGPVDSGEMLLYGEGNRWSKEYTDLTRDLYLPRS